MSALLIYSSHDGQCKKIMQVIAEEVSQKQNYELWNISDVQQQQLDLNTYSLIVLGAAVRYGKFNRQFSQFVSQYTELLNQLNSVFFSVSLTARKTEKRTIATHNYTRKLLERSGWQPKQIAIFAGALRYANYRWVDRKAIQLIMRITGGETDLNSNIEYTDWAQVKTFAQKI